MRAPRAVYLVLAVALIAGLLPMMAAAKPAAPAEIEPGLLTRLEAEPANFLVRMSLQADLSAASGMDWIARGRYVYDSLSQVARTTQAPVVDYAARHGLEYTSFVNGNEVYIRGGDLAAAQDLAALSGVAALYLERTYAVDPILSGDASPEYTTDWGLVDVNADDVWALGYQGAGIKVANIDTGVQYNHPALDQAFACPSDPGNPACWKDPSNICAGGTACDNNGHGTHTMGTMVGDNDPALTYWVGMAPDATWIACKGCETNYCSEFALNSCADWLLAPGGNPDDRPHIVNNSWGDPGGNAWYRTKVQSWRAAGIFPAFSAGNSGSSCASLGSPGDYQESFASAAHGSNRAIASWSSRGPSDYGHELYTKPNLSAPGVNVCSAVPTNAWSCSYSGTSMASPHAAGAVALVWQACPGYLGRIDDTFELLQSNADASPLGSCSRPPDGQGNYTYGYGYLNALKAVQACSAPCVPVSNAAFTWTPASPYAMYAVTFSASAGGKAPIGYTWSFGDGATGTGRSVTHIYGAPGDYSVSLTASNDCGSQTVLHTVSVQPTPPRSLHMGQNSLSFSGTNPSYTVTATVVVHDRRHRLVGGVKVYGTWTLPDGRVRSRTAVTQADGTARLPITGPAGLYQWCVTDLARTGYAYEQDGNHVPACLNRIVP